MRATVVHRAATAVRQWLCLALVAAIPSIGSADTAKGLTWLQAQVQTGGQLASVSSAATVAQSRCEVARTLLELSGPGTAPAALTAALDGAALGETVTEVLACAQWLQQKQSQIPRTSELQSRLTLTNGFAAFEGQTGPSALDTGWALQALASQWSSAQTDPTLAWLQQQQKADGSFTLSTGSDLLTTASVLRGLKDHRQRSAAAAAIADKAASYLLAQANAAGHWQSNVGVTALVYEAVHPYSGTQPALASAVQTWLLAGQATNGAWNNNDPWTSAVALRALVLTGRPPVNPAQAALKLQFVDGRTGTPISGVQLTGTGAGNLSAGSNASGQIQVQGLAPGAYTLTATATGYSTVQITATLQTGQTTDLGTVQMLVPASSTTAVISGTVRDSASGSPLAGVTISITGQAMTGTTDANGLYLINGVAPGAITLKASRTGYFDATGQANVQAGQTVNFSPSLVLSTAGGPGGTADCRILGTVTKAADGTPVAAATVTVSGANTGTATTDASGAYVLTGLVSGDTRISVSLSGFDVAVANTRLNCSPQGGTALQYSPKLYPTSQAPADANTTSLSGMVMDAGTNQPIAAAQLTVTTNINIIRNGVSQANGSFTLSGLDGATAQLVVVATGYEGLTATYTLQPGQTIDLGQIRLRPPKVTQLTLDLQVQSVKRHTTQTDPQTLRVSGALQVQVRNAGTLPAPANVPVLAFQDSNGNGQYDPSADTVLGQTTLPAALGAGQSQTLTIDVAGSLPFRDAPIHVVVDPSGALAESDKANNVRSSAQDVLFVPQGGGTFTPKLKWEWNGDGSSNPTSKQVMMAPIAIPTRDTNGDGKVNSEDVSDIVVVSYEGYYTNPSGTIRILSGVDGSEVRSIAARKVVNVGGLAAADLDGDGIPEIVATSAETGLPVAYRVTGEVYWAATNGDTGNFMPSNGGVWGSAFIADLDADGVPEVVMKGDVFSGRTGALLWSANGPYFGSTDSSYPRAYSLPVVADLFGTGKQNLILGASVYDHQGSLVWKNSQVGEGHVAIADFDSDGTPEIVHINRGRVSLMDRFGKLLWGPILAPNSDGVWGGPPTIADFDGDGVPDIGVSGRRSYTVLRADGSVLWWIPAKDYGSGMTGSTSFDFLGDGKAKILYSDESSIFVLDGATGNQLIRLGSDSATTFEYPIVVDADRDGHAEFVTIRNQYGAHADADIGAGVRVYEDANGGWVPTRSIWNQHAYSITNINDDLSVPRNPEPSWKSHNTFRLNRRMDADPRAIADITASYVRVVDMGAQPGSRIIVRVGNAGSYKVPAGTPVAIYNTNPAQGQPTAAALVALGTTQSVLESGAYEDLAFAPALPLSQLSAQGTVWIVADDDGAGKHSLPDFDRSNNLIMADLIAIASSLKIAAATDKSSYAGTDTAIFTATVHNLGSFARDALVRFTVEDVTGSAVATLPIGGPVRVLPGANGQASATWRAAAVLAGGYQLRAELITPEGVAYGSAIAPFVVLSGAGPGSSGINSTRIRTDRTRYNTTGTVLIESQMANISTNQLQNNLLLSTTVVAPGGLTVLVRNESLAQVMPRGQRQYQYSLPAASLAPGQYQALLQLTEAAGTVLSQSASSFVVDGSQPGAGITGTLQAMPSTVASGSQTQLQLSVSNGGAAAVSGATVRVRVLDPANGAVLSAFERTGVQLATSASATYTWDWLADAAAGAVLPVAATIELGGTGIETPIAQTTLQITAGAALQPLVGTLAASPRSIPAGGTVQLNYTARNPNGRSVDADLALTIRAAGSSALLERWLMPQSLPAQASLAGSKGWTPSGVAGTTYEARWTVTVNGATTTLATDTFSTGTPGASVQAQIGSGSDARVLVLVSCSAADDGQAQSLSCDEAKAEAVRAFLSSQGVKSVVVTTRAEFETQMRCGNFNVYWVSGGSGKLSDTAVKELREAAERGAGLLIDGAQAARDSALHGALGIVVQGASGAASPLATLGGTIFSPMGDMPVQGTPVRYGLQGATQQGSLTGGAVAAASRDVGKGRGLAFAFSFATLAAQAQAISDGRLAAVLQSTLRYLSSPAYNTNAAQAPQTLATDLYNDGSEAVNVRLQAVLPTGVRFVDSSHASVPATPTTQANGETPVEWSIALPPGASAVLALQVSAAVEGSYNIPVLIETRSAAAGANAPATSQTLTHSLAVRSAQNLASDAAQTLAGLQPGGTSDANAAVAARAAVANAGQLMGQGRNAESLLQWVAAADAVRSLSGSVNPQTRANARLAIALALQAAQRQLCQQWACITGKLGFSVNNQASRQVPLGGTIVGSRTLFNNCPSQIKDIPVTSLWVNRRNDATVQNLWDNLTIAGNQNNRRDNGWQAQGQGGDTIDVTLTAEWQGLILHLDRDAFRIVINPPILSGGVTASPTRAKTGQNVTITRTIRNSGAMAKDIPVRLRTTNVTRGGSAQIWSQSLTLNPGETHNGNTNWQVQGTAGDVIRVQMTATIGAVEQSLGSVDFTVDP